LVEGLGLLGIRLFIIFGYNIHGKMKPLFLLLLSFPIFLHATDKPKNKIGDKHLNGKIKSVKKVHALISSTKSGEFKVKFTMDRMAYWNNSAGDDTLMKLTNYKFNGDSSREVIISKYDAKDSLIEVIQYDPSNRSKIYETAETKMYKYDSMTGFRIEEDVYRTKGALLYINRFKYDKWGNLSEINEYTAEGIMESTMGYKYDSIGHLLEKSNRYHNIKSSDSYIDKYTYDNNGNKVAYKCFDSNSILKWETTYKYDEKRNIIEEETFTYEQRGGTDQTSDYKNVYKYDSTGMIEKVHLDKFNTALVTYTYKRKYDNRHLIQDDEYKDGTLSRHYAYDVHGNQLESDEYYNGTLYKQYKREYTYDEYDNIIKQITFEDGEPLSMEVWTIEY
jgi:hypothetical protein